MELHLQMNIQLEEFRNCYKILSVKLPNNYFFIKIIMKNEKIKFKNNYKLKYGNTFK